MKTKTDTLVRSIMFFIALINYILNELGIVQINADEHMVYAAVVVIVTVVIFCWSWWKNNSFTEAAKKADEYLEQLKNSEE